MTGTWHPLFALNAFLALAQPALAQDTACTSLEKIVGAGEKRFAVWKGKYDSELDEFESRYTMPGTEHCSIDTDADVNFGKFSCSWLFGSEASAQQKEQQLVSELRACLMGNEHKVTVYQVTGRRGISSNTEIDLGYLQPKLRVTRRPFDRGKRK